MKDGFDARRFAAHAFDRAWRGKGALEDSLNAAPGFELMDSRDRAFSRLIAATTLRRVGQTQAALDAFLDKPLPDDAHVARALLLTGAAQLIWLDTPPHAAVSGAVGLAKESPATARYSGLINAVLRKVVGNGKRFAKATPARDNLPAWLRDSWVKTYGVDKTESMAEAVTREPTLDLTLRQPDEAEHWAEQIGAEILKTGSLRKVGIGDVRALAGYEDGAWWLQDAGASIPARLLNVQPGEAVLDLCAAPGGKTLQLAAAGGTVTALDASGKRLKKLEANLARTGLSADIIVANGRTWRSDDRFDAILLDAPCTATGTLRRRPDAAWMKQAGDAASLSPIQDDLFSTAVEALRPGGRLVICTCSLQPEEGRQWLERGLAAHAGMSVVPVTPDELPGLTRAVQETGSVQLSPDLWSEQGGIDGFFIARLVKAAD